MMPSITYALPCLLCVLLLPGCSSERGTQQSSTTFGVNTQPSLLKTLPVKTPFMPDPVQGLFVGVSDYYSDTNLESNLAFSLGAIIMHSVFSGLVHPPDHQTGAPGNRLRLIADVQRKLNDDGLLNLDLLFHLGEFQVRYVDAERRAFFGPDKKTGRYDVIGDGEPVTKARFQHELDEALTAYGKAAREKKRGWFILYLNTHGIRASNGETVALFSDSLEAAPETGMFTEAILQQCYDLQRRLLAEEIPSRMLLMIDCCRVAGSAVSAPPVRPGAEKPAGIVTIYSATPGQYAWQWSSKTRLEFEVSKVKSNTAYAYVMVDNKQLKIPARPGTFDKGYEAKMSILPWAFLTMRETTRFAGIKRLDDPLLMSNEDFYIGNKLVCGNLLVELRPMQDDFTLEGLGWRRLQIGNSDELSLNAVCFLTGVANYARMLDSITKEQAKGQHQTVQMDLTGVTEKDDIFLLNHEEIKILAALGGI